MIHQPPKDFLYSSYQLTTNHSDGETTITNQATAFVVSHSKAWIVTNRHVLDLNYRQPNSKYKDFKLVSLSIVGRNPDDTVYEIDLQTRTAIHYHQDSLNDVAMIEARSVEKSKHNLHFHFEMDALADEAFFQELQPFDEICFTGFPEEHDKLSNRPILRRGSIASDPRYNYSWDSSDKGQCIAYEGFSSAGASGSPVLCPARGGGVTKLRQGKLIGINAGQVLTSKGHKGISYLYKTTAIIDIIKSNSL